MLKMGAHTKNIIASLPYIIFIAVYIFLCLHEIYIKNIFSLQVCIMQNIALCAAFFAVICAFFSFQEKITLDKKIEIFYSGIANIHAIEYYCMIIALATFNHLIGSTNGILTAATLGLLYIPTFAMFPIMFIGTAIAQTNLLHIPTTIIVFLPIGYGIAQSLHSNIVVMAATVVTGALCGHHGIVHFQNHTSNVSNRSMYNSTIKIIYFAIIITCLLLSRYSYTLLHSSMIQLLTTRITWDIYILLIPYIFLFIAAFYRMNIFANIMVASCLAVIIKILYFNMPITQTLTLIFSGFYDNSTMCSMLLFEMIFTGFTNIIRYNRGFDYLDCIKKKYIKKIDAIYTMTASTIEIIIPYGLPMTLAMYISKCSYFDLLQYMIYPAIILFFMLNFLLFSGKSSA